MLRSRIVCALVLLITLLAYWPVRHHDFVNYDDPAYVTQNPMVQAGLTWGGTEWAFTTWHTANWHPLTWLSLMLDCQLFGLNAGGHHLVSVAIHAINAVLLFLLLHRATCGFWQSALVAAVFAWHPLRVESVAWVAERKDVLSAFFGLLALMAYVRYAQSKSVAEGGVRGAKGWVPGSDTRAQGSSKRGKDGPSLDYVLALFLFGLGLMSKPMLVTLPFLMLLMDYWPLRRVADFTPRNSRWARLALEKSPFFALAAASCVVTFAAQREAGAVAALNREPLNLRLENAAVAYVKYLLKTVCPVDLAVIYPMPKEVPGIQVLASIVVLAAISWTAWRARRRRPYLVMGWLWFLGMLVPVIGLVQVGAQSMADRYTYLPLIGVTIGAAFGLADMATPLRIRAPVVIGASCAVLAGCLLVTSRQLRFWSNSEVLFNHALAVTRDNFVAHDGLGVALFDRGQVDEAMSHMQKALDLEPDYLWAHCNLGSVLLSKGRVDEAAAHFVKALAIQPGSAKARNNLGSALVRMGRFEEAISQFQKALETQPYNVMARSNLAHALLKQGRLDEAIAQFRHTLAIQHNLVEARSGLANALLQKGQVDDAIIHFQEALRDRPGDADSQNGLGSALLQKGKADEARVHLQKAVEIRPDDVQARNNLGIALSWKGRLDEATIQFQQALQLDPNNESTHNNLGNLFLQQGKVNEAMAQFQRALEAKPDYAKAHFNLGRALLQEKDLDGAILHFEKTVEIEPGYVQARQSLGNLLLTKGRVDDGIVQFQKILEIRPDDVSALNNLAWIRAVNPQERLRDGAEAVRLAERACRVTHYTMPGVVETLAAAYAEAGRFDDAVATSEKARELAVSLAQKEVADRNAALIQLFRNRQPYREPAR